MPLLLYTIKRKTVSLFSLGCVSMSVYDSDQTVIADNKSGTWYNAKADTSVYGKLITNTHTSDLKVTKIKYSSTGTNNLGKRVQYIDLYKYLKR